MQNAKDTFYLTLQSRLAAINPARTIVLRGVVRPGILVEENELPTASVLTDAFRLDWTALQTDLAGPMPLVTMICSIRYATDGTPGSGGMDRGRLLAGMDAELLSALGAAPHHAAKMNYAAPGAGVSPVTMATNIFWSDPVFAVADSVDERLERTATVQVLAYQEAGEL